MIKPPRLKPGDTIGIVSPSWGGAGAYPHRVEQGIRQIEALGFKARLAPHALGQHGFVSATPEQRASDLHSMFADPEVNAILATIGGDHACHLLPRLDFDLIQSHPKILMGFSDNTVLNVAIWQRTGLVTFNGPMLLTDFGELPHLLEYTERNFLKAVAGNEPPGKIEPATRWTEEFLDWDGKKDQERPRALQPSRGWTWLKTGRVESRQGRRTDAGKPLLHTGPSSQYGGCRSLQAADRPGHAVKGPPIDDRSVCNGDARH